MSQTNFYLKTEPDSTLALNLDPDTQLVTVDDPSPTISVLWDRAVQQAVIDTSPGPTIASRAYSMVHTAMFDAWAAYDFQAISTQLADDLQRPETEITEANKTEAMSYGAYRVLVDLFPEQKHIFTDLMAELGFDPHNNTKDTNTAAGIGNISALALLEFRHQDASNQLAEVPYAPNRDYHSVNEHGHSNYIDRWTAEYIPIDAQDPAAPVQEFLTPHWGEVVPFGLASPDQFRPVAPKPFLLVPGEVDLEAKTIRLADTGEVFPISEALIGSVINPDFIAQAETVVEASANLTDEQKLIAEFWEDGENTSFPPGTWMTFGEFVSARDEHSLDEDAQMFFILANAVFDAGIATWESKTHYDYARPVRVIRTLGELGLIGEYNVDLGGHAIAAWAGTGAGTQTILASEFMTYQTPGSHPSPPFAEYTSGHSAFSAAGAEVLELYTGSEEFGASVTFKPGSSRFELGITPEETLTLEWSTFDEAADEAGISRIYGGIHFEDGDFNGRLLGQEVGRAVWEQAQYYIQGGEVQSEASDTIVGDRCRSDLINTADDANVWENVWRDRESTVLIDGKDNREDARVGSCHNRIEARIGDEVFVPESIDRLSGEDYFPLVDPETDDFWAAVGRLPNTVNLGVGDCL